VVRTIPLCLPHIQATETIRVVLQDRRIPRDLVRMMLGYILPSPHTCVDLPCLADWRLIRRFLLHRQKCGSKGHCHGAVIYTYPLILDGLGA